MGLPDSLPERLPGRALYVSGGTCAEPRRAAADWSGFRNPAVSRGRLNQLMWAVMA